MKKPEDTLEDATKALTKQDDMIKASFFISAALSLVTRRPVHLLGFGTAYLLGERPALVKEYQHALNGRPDNYPGLFGDSQLLNSLSQSTSSFFSQIKNTCTDADVQNSIGKVSKNIQEEVKNIFRKK